MLTTTILGAVFPFLPFFDLYTFSSSTAKCKNCSMAAGVMVQQVKPLLTIPAPIL